MGKWVIFINTREACLDLKLVSWFSEKFSGLFCNRALTIGQMQGKFQMVVVRHTGHAIQEDVPEEFSNLILNFISRNRIGPHGVEIPGLRRPSQSQP